MKKMMKKQEGFTLIELIIVIAILAIIAAVAIPNIMGAVENSRKATDVSNGKVLMNAAATVIAKNDTIDTSSFAGTTNGQHIVSTLVSTGFEGKLKEQINGTAPSPKYKSGTYDTFLIEIDSKQNISVYAYDTSGTGTKGPKVAPDADSDYNQD